MRHPTLGTTGRGAEKMPYPDERAGLAAIRAIVDSGELDEFRSKLQPPNTDAVLDLPPFKQCPQGTSRTHLVAIDGSQVYDRFPGRLPDTHAGAVSLGVVVIKLHELHELHKRKRRLPASGAVDPRRLRDTESGHSLGALLPGTNARSVDGLAPSAVVPPLRERLARKHLVGRRDVRRDPLCPAGSVAHDPQLPQP